MMVMITFQCIRAIYLFILIHAQKLINGDEVRITLRFHSSINPMIKKEREAWEMIKKRNQPFTICFSFPFYNYQNKPVKTVNLQSYN